MERMKGFDKKYRDCPDYILGITREIWEDRNIHTLRECYANDIIVRSPTSVVVGNQDVIAATLATLHEFPDRTLLGEDVIWTGTPETGFLSSHRILSTATHGGDGVYGPATGTPIHYRIIADCHARNNTIDDEWIIRDQGAIVRQLGWEPAAFVADRLQRISDDLPQTLTPATDRAGPYTGQGNTNPWGARLAEIITRILQADLGAIPDTYDRACALHHPGGRTAHGRQAADGFWISLRSAFPDAELTIHHVMGREDDRMPPRAALRWSLWGRHTGMGAFGTPSGALVYVLGITHAEFGPYGLRREYTLYDELAIWQQILSPTANPGTASSNG